MLSRWWNHSPEEAARRLNAALERTTRKQVRSAVLFVDAPQHGIAQCFAHGVANVDSGTPMTPETPFLSASVGKLFVATAVLRLVALRRLALEDPVVRWVPLEELAGLPVQGGDEALSQITVAMLLAHRSGLPDYFSDNSRDGSPRLFDRLVSERDRSWSRSEMLAYARDHYDAVGAPGQKFHYADTNYDLLGMVLEGVTGRQFHEVVRELVIAPLGLAHTWYHAFEAAPRGLPTTADVWVLDTNLSGAASLSADQAGGGLVTTAADLRALMRGLVEGRPIAFTELDADFTVNAMHSGIDVGRCVWRIRPGGIFFALGGLPTLVGHSGATGVWAYYAADWDAVIVGAVSDSSWQERHIRFLLSDVLPVLARTRRK